MNTLPAFVSPLSDLAVIQISGADAISFMQSQLTQDLTKLIPGQAVLAGYCTPKGRLLATMVLWSDPESDDTPRLYALTKGDLTDALIKRLTMFVLRAKVKVSAAPLSVWGVLIPTASPEELSLEGLADAGITSAAGLLYSALELLPVQPLPYSCIHTDNGIWIAAPASSTNTTRWWHISQVLNPEPQANQNGWHAADIAAGLPWVTAALQDLFIPQTMNLDLIEGVSFTKGCYPGQEIVARSHYRGTIKRRMAYGVVRITPSDDSSVIAGLEGKDIFNANLPNNPCGRIMNAAVGLDQQLHLLMEVQLSDLSHADFRLESAQGQPITMQTLPYRIQE